MSQVTRKFLFHCENGKIRLDDNANFVRALAKFEGKDGFLVLERFYRQRTIRENRYLWGCVIPILVDETEDFGGWDKEAVYRWLEWRFLNNYDKPQEWVKIRELSTYDFEELMERIRRWAAIEVGADIPEPHEVEITGDVVL